MFGYTVRLFDRTRPKLKSPDSTNSAIAALGGVVALIAIGETLVPRVIIIGLRGRPKPVANKSPIAI
jgi:hypothetical protein